jgi:hypothetical protein
VVNKMNDPHVDALHYRISYTDAVDYANAVPREYDGNPAFVVRIADGNAKITMKEHFATVEDARKFVDPFLKAWELSAALDRPQDQFEFIYQRYELIDRNPSPGVISIEPAQLSLQGSDVTLVDRLGTYPDPPDSLGWDPNIDLLFNRYRLWAAKRTSLNDAANFCLTLLEAIPGSPSKRRKNAASHFCVDVDVLRKVGELSTTKGGPDARKAEGASEDFTEKERVWLESALKALIRRVAQKVYSPAGLQKIKMDDLPSLEV